MQLFRVADHGKQALVLRHAVNREVGVEDLVAAMLAVGLRKHHQLDVGRVALELGEGIDQVVDLVHGQRQAKFAVGGFQRRLAAGQYINGLQGRCVQLGEKACGFGTVRHHAFGHAVMQQRRHLLALDVRQGGLAQQLGFERELELRDAFYAPDGQAAIAGNVRGFGRPGRNRAEARRHDKDRASGGAGKGSRGRLAITQQGCQLALFSLCRQGVSRHQVHKTCMDAHNFLVDGLQAREELLDAEIAQGIDALGHALKSRQVQGHGSGGLVVVAGSREAAQRWLARPQTCARSGVRVNPEFYPFR
ncbi:hypothetical protein D9M73_64900 [compost metagenome]